MTTNDDSCECAFCEGRDAAEAGLTEKANPYTPVDGVDENDSIAFYETDYGFWLLGFSVGKIDWSTVKPIRISRNKAQDVYDNNPELRELLSRAAESPTVSCERRTNRTD